MANNTIMALCASYINSETRLKHLFVMLSSWVNQAHMLCSMYIGVSITDEGLLKQFKEKFEKFKKVHSEELNGISLVASISKKQLKQFQQYKRIIDECASLIKINPWIIFTDDDDIWHPNRLVMYDYAIKNIASQNLVDVDHINCPYYVESVGIDAKDYSTYTDVDKGIREGTIIKSKSGANYVFSCVRMERLHYFLKNANDELLDCAYADTRFCHFIQSEGRERGKRSMHLTECWQDGWMYFYRHVSDPLGSITNNKDKLPDCLSFSSELKAKFENLQLEPKKKQQIISLLNFIELSICTGIEGKRDILKEYEVKLLKWGVPVICISKEIRPLYKIIDDFLEHSYYRNLMKYHI